MQIQCPHCKSRYRLGAEMTDTYGGFVRCGNCNYKFNIHDQVSFKDEYNSLLNTAQRPSQRWKSDENKPEAPREAPPQRIEPRLESDEEDELNIRFGEDELEDQLDSKAIAEPQRKEPQFDDFSMVDGEVNSIESNTSLQKAYLPEADQLKDVPDTPNTDVIAEPQRKEPQFNDFSIAAGDVDSGESNLNLQQPRVPETGQLEDLPGASASDDLPLPAEHHDRTSMEPGSSMFEPGVDTELFKPDEDNYLDPDNESETETHESLNFNARPETCYQEYSSGLSLINDEAREDSHQPGFFGDLFSTLWRAIQFIFWLLLVAVLAYLLFSQVRDTLYPVYKNHPVVQRINASICEYFPCKDVKYNIDLLEIAVSRMDEVNAPGRQFHISIFLLNKAQSAQPYPNILLTLKTVDGSISAQRVISPLEYSTSHDSLITSSSTDEDSSQALIKPNKLGKIFIKLANPPQDAVGFEALIVK